MLKLYVKTWCPWCVMAIRFLDERGYKFEQLDVENDRVAAKRMREISGQSLTPTLEYNDLVLPDFGPDELEIFLKKHKIEP